MHKHTVNSGNSQRSSPCISILKLHPASKTTIRIVAANVHKNIVQVLPGLRRKMLSSGNGTVLVDTYPDEEARIEGTGGTCEEVDRLGESARFTCYVAKTESGGGG